MSTPASPPPQHAVSCSFFLRVGDRVKKVSFSGELTDLVQLFKNKFPDELGKSEARISALWIVDDNLKKEAPVQSVADLTPNCICEWKEPFKKVDQRRQSKIHSQTIFQGVQRDQIVFCLVGLPATGKTYISRKLATYLNWLGVTTRVFHVANYRRERLGAKPAPEWFNPTNQEAMKVRLHMAIAALDDMVEWLHDGGKVGIYDGTNLSAQRRKLVLTRCEQEGFEVVFLESVGSDPKEIEHNILQTYLSSPDYASGSQFGSIEDVKEKIRNFQRQYDPLEENDTIKYIRLYDLGRKVEVRNIRTYLPCRATFFLMNLHTYSRPIWLARAAPREAASGEYLSAAGDEYSAALAEWLAERVAESEPVTVWTSTVKRALQTAHYIARPKVKLRQLDDMDKGDLEGITLDELAGKQPDEYAALKANPLTYRFPRGESYEDVIHRLEPLIFELERARHPILIISHATVLQCLFAYFMSRDPEEAPFIDVPSNTVIELMPRAFTCDIKHYPLVHGEPAVHPPPPSSPTPRGM